jgi:ABC-type uncharacterized transport system permease subunit
MRRALRVNRALRTVFVLLLVTGVVVHLWISSRVGLVMVAFGFAAHLAAALAGRRWLLHNRPRPDTRPPDPLSR